MKMNKTMLLGEVANRSGIPADECGVVLKTFERVLCEELTRKLYRYGGWILLLIGLFISAFAFGQISSVIFIFAPRGVRHTKPLKAWSMAITGTNE